ncbi:histidine kinase [Bacteroidales bacterium OttesenSCG-928-M06]|nr:histidine kinase [Bacteroidales bacterium OttesenSCG-928-M06]
MKHDDISCDQFAGYGRKTALQLSIIIGVIFTVIMLISYLYARSRDIVRMHNLLDLFTLKTISNLVTNTLLLYILFLFQFWVIKNHTSPKKKVLIIVCGSILLLFILSPFFAHIQWMSFKEHIPKNVFLSIHFVKDMIVLLIALLFTALIYMWDQNQKTILENQRLSMMGLQNRYDALKNQVDPHFLFNSLNTLNGLIGYDDDKAHDYLDQLSSVFRYTMQNKQIIQLADELNFVQSYISLMKIRYNEGLQIEYKVKEEYLNYYILSFGLQTLIENAIKHNVVSNKYPLTIIIETTDKDTICVQNTIRLKPDKVEGGIGLANLNERYLLVFNKEVIINQDDVFFSVEIPLIQGQDIEKYNKKFSNI